MNEKIKKGRFNSADLIVIIGVVMLLLGILFRRPLDDITRERFNSVDITYTIECPNADSHLHERLNVGDTVYLSDNGESIGIVSAIRFSPSVIYSLRQDNTLERKNNPAMKNAVITLQTSGIQDEHGVYINDGWFLAPGKNFSIYTNQDRMNVTVKEVGTVSKKNDS